MTTELVKSKGRAAAKRNNLKGHDKTGTGKGSSPKFAIPSFIGIKGIETNAGMQGKIGVSSTSEQAWEILAQYYISKGYRRGPNHTMIKDGEPVIVLPKKSKMIRLKTGKAGRAMPKTKRSGIIVP